MERRWFDSQAPYYERKVYIMKVKELNLPFGIIQVLVNGVATEFEFQESSYNTYFLDEKEIKVLGAVDITIDPEEFEKGDIIFVNSSVGNLIEDGGDEGTVNAVAELAEYTYAIGGPDTEFIEWNYDNIPGDIPDAKSFGYKKHELKYELIEICSDGIKYQIVNGNESCQYANGKLSISVVWESNKHEYAFDIVAFLSC